MCVKEICSNFYYKDLNFLQDLTKMHTYTKVALKPAKTVPI